MGGNNQTHKNKLMALLPGTNEQEKLANFHTTVTTDSSKSLNNQFETFMTNLQKGRYTNLHKREKKL